MGLLSEAFRPAMGAESVSPTASTAHAFDSCADGKVLAEYIWVTGGAALQSRTVVLDAAPARVEELPVAEVDGTSTGQASYEHCELYLRPRKVFPDPLRGGHHILVLCDTYSPEFDGPNGTPQLKPHGTNSRVACEEVMGGAAEHAPVFAAQQEYSVLDPATGLPYGVPSFGGGAQKPLWPHQQSPKAARDVSDMHMHACMRAGLRVSGAQQLAVPGIWAFKLGPCEGVELGDQLWTSRLLLQRVGERCGVRVSFDPRPDPAGCLLGTGGTCSLEFSTKSSRVPGQGILAMQQHIVRLQAHHAEHCCAYCTASPSPPLAPLLAGSPEAHSCLRRNASFSSTSSAASLTFTCGVGDKRASVMIPSSTLLNKCGPIVDRRPPSNMDPYLSTLLLASAALDLPLPAASARSLQQLSSSPHGTASLTGYSGGASLTSSGPGSSLSDFCDSEEDSDDASCGSDGNSEELLISELDRRDQFLGRGCSGAMGGGLSGDFDDEGCGEVNSDGTSPMSSEGSLAAACAYDDRVEFYE